MPSSPGQLISMFKCSSGEVAEAVASLEATFSSGKSFCTRDILEEFSKSALFSQSVWVEEEIRIMSKQVDGAEALEEPGVGPRRAIDVLMTSFFYCISP